MVLGQEKWRVGHVQDGVVDQHHFAEVKLVGEAFPFGFVQNALVVVVPVKKIRWGGEEEWILREEAGRIKDAGE